MIKLLPLSKWQECSISRLVRSGWQTLSHASNPHHFQYPQKIATPRPQSILCSFSPIFTTAFYPENPPAQPFSIIPNQIPRNLPLLYRFFSFLAKSLGDNRSPGIATEKRLKFQFVFFNWANRRNRKKGAPKSDVTIPTGISTGAIKIRASKSARTSSPPPRSTENKTVWVYWLEPQSLDKCGTIKATNPIGPHVETTAPTKSARPKKEKIRKFVMFNPLLWAKSSPVEISKNSLLNKKTTSKKNNNKTDKNIASLYPATEIPPINQRTSENVSEKSKIY